MDTDGLAQLEGQTALVETGGWEATGTVTSVALAAVAAAGAGAGAGSGVELTVTCDEETWAGSEIGDVEICVFAADALYRFSGWATVKGLELSLGPDASMERIQRRKWPRRRLDLAVTVCPVADGRRVEGVPGRTVDVGIGGVCVETLRPVEGEGNPMVILSLPDGTTIVSLTSTVGIEDLGDGWRYRLAFQDLDAHDAGRIAELVG